ncbi:MAG: Gmad2 immunoglobulin-like domain-containing protein [bacterium]|nr:Gmad2 immunoglobulin-like domain-containing protein [bacterium]
MKKFVIAACVLALIILALWLSGNIAVTQKGTADYKNAMYLIAGKPITLVDGKAEIAAAPGSESKEIVAIFGEPIFKDLDRDGDDDVLFLLTKDSGGSGTFYYVAVAVNENGLYKGTNAMFLGDRIAPQTIGFQEGRAVVNFAVRAPEESFAVAPHIGKSVWIHLDAKKFEIGEWVKDFEGEADIAVQIQVTTPVPNQKVSSPLIVKGKARGNWYFEAAFPIAIIDANGIQLGVASAEAQSAWTTSDFVPFEATLEFEKSATSTGILLLKKDNPSGLQEKDASISIPISF